jgi:hypothetical protein
MSEPLVPVTLTVSFPQKKPALTVSVDVRLRPEATMRLGGLSEAVRLEKEVAADRMTVPENPPTDASVIVAVVDEPGGIVAEGGFTLRAKPGAGDPIRVIVFTIRSVL